MNPSDETLMAYVDGELDEQARGEVEAAMRSNPDLAARVSRQQALRTRVHLAFAKVLDERVPDRLVAAARGPATRTRDGKVVPSRRPPPRRWSWPEWVSMAASLGAGAILTFMILRHSDPVPVTSRDGQLFANATLAQALSSQLASTPQSSPVRIGVSFRDKSGAYCRTFAVSGASALAGLACHEGDGWRVDILAQAHSDGSGTAAQYRPAASSMPAPVLQSVQERIAGDPLDAQAEAAARDHGWAH